MVFRSPALRTRLSGGTWLLNEIKMNISLAFIDQSRDCDKTERAGAFSSALNINVI